MTLGMAQQITRQLNSGATAHPHALTGKSPHHTGTIGDHQLSSSDGLTQRRIGARRHGHFGVEGDDLPPTSGMKSNG